MAFLFKKQQKHQKYAKLSLFEIIQFFIQSNKITIDNRHLVNYPIVIKIHNNQYFLF